MSSKFDTIYNSVLSENTTPAPQPNPNIAKDVQDFFAKHQNTTGFFDVLAKQIESAQKAQQQAQQQAAKQPTPQQNNQQPAPQNNQQQPAQQQNNQQQGQPQNQQQNPQQQNQQQRK